MQQKKTIRNRSESPGPSEPAPVGPLDYRAKLRKTGLIDATEPVEKKGRYV
jgi:hypothetical protein